MPVIDPNTSRLVETDVQPMSLLQAHCSHGRYRWRPTNYKSNCCRLRRRLCCLAVSTLERRKFTTTAHASRVNPHKLTHVTPGTAMPLATPPPCDTAHARRSPKTLPWQRPAAAAEAQEINTAGLALRPLGRGPLLCRRPRNRNEYSSTRRSTKLEASAVSIFYLIHSQLHKIHRVPVKRQSYRIQL